VRICLYSEKVLPGVGGQEMVVDRLARGFLARGHTVVVLAPRGRGWVRETDAGLPYATFRHPRFRSTRWFVASHGWWLARLQRRHALDVVHCHGVYPSGYVAARCAAVAGVPLVITSHGGDIDDASPLGRKPRLAPRYRQALGRADAVVAVSEFIETRLRQWCEPDARIERIAHGVDLARYSAAVPRPAELDPRIRSGKYFLFLGRVVRRKGVDLLLAAFERVASNTDVHLVIAGDGTSYPVVQTAASRLSLAERIVLDRWVEGDAKTWLLQNAICNVVPSRHSEAFGLTVLESFASGRPVVATAIPGLRELVVPEHNGLLVAPESVDGLARALREAMDRPEWFDELGRRAVETASWFSWDNAVERHLALYEDLVRRGTRKA